MTAQELNKKFKNTNTKNIDSCINKNPSRNIRLVVLSGVRMKIYR